MESSQPLNFGRVVRMISKLSLMKYFPASDGDIVVSLAEEIAAMCHNEDQVQWLVNRAVRLYPEWPGIGELRACFCSKWKPKDLIEQHSTVYLDGIPSEKPAQPLQLGPPPGHQISENADFDRTVMQLAAAKDLNSPSRSRIVQEIPTARTFTPVTQADIEAAEKEYRQSEQAKRDQQARVDLGITEEQTA